MPLIGYSPSNKGRQAWLAIFLSQSVLAAAMLEPTMEKPSKADDDTQQSRSRSSSIREEPSHQASLMAGIRILGPSDVPCLVETSTAHGDLLFSVTISSIGMVKLSGSFSYISNLVQDPQISPLPSPKLPESPENLSTNPYGRRLAQICFLPTKEKLGFQLVGSSKAGPISLLKPKYKRSNPKQNLQKPRSVLKIFLSILSCSMCRLLEKIDRRHQLKQQSPWLLWMYKNSMRTLLKEIQSSIDLTCQIVIQPLHLYCLMRDPNHLLKEKPLDTSSFMERTLSWNLHPWPPMSKVKNCHCFLVFGSPVPVTPKAKVTSTTSPNLLIVTNLYFADLFAKAFSTHHDLACGKVLRCFCLRVPMNLSLNFEAYPLWFSTVILIFFVLVVSNHEVEELVTFPPFWV